MMKKNNKARAIKATRVAVVTPQVAGRNYWRNHPQRNHCQTRPKTIMVKETKELLMIVGPSHIKWIHARRNARLQSALAAGLGLIVACTIWQARGLERQGTLVPLGLMNMMHIMPQLIGLPLPGCLFPWA